MDSVKVKVEWECSQCHMITTTQELYSESLFASEKSRMHWHGGDVYDYLLCDKCDELWWENRPPGEVWIA